MGGSLIGIAKTFTLGVHDRDSFKKGEAENTQGARGRLGVQVRRGSLIGLSEVLKRLDSLEEGQKNLRKHGKTMGDKQQTLGRSKIHQRKSREVVRVRRCCRMKSDPL